MAWCGVWSGGCRVGTLLQPPVVGGPSEASASCGLPSRLHEQRFLTLLSKFKDVRLTSSAPALPAAA